MTLSIDRYDATGYAGQTVRILKTNRNGSSSVPTNAKDGTLAALTELDPEDSYYPFLVDFGDDQGSEWVHEVGWLPVIGAVFAGANGEIQLVDADAHFTTYQARWLTNTGAAPFEISWASLHLDGWRYIENRPLNKDSGGKTGEYREGQKIQHRGEERWETVWYIGQVGDARYVTKSPEGGAVLRVTDETKLRHIPQPLVITKRGTVLRQIGGDEEMIVLTVGSPAQCHMVWHYGRETKYNLFPNDITEADWEIVE